MLFFDADIEYKINIIFIAESYFADLISEEVPFKEEGKFLKLFNCIFI